MSKSIEARSKELQQELSRPIQLVRTMRQLWKGESGQLPPEDWEVSWYTISDEIPIPELNEEWLLNEATPQEARELIDGWLSEYQTHFTQPKDSTVAKEYGIERRVSPHLARALAYLALFQEYGDRSSAHSEKIGEAAAQRDAKRAEVNAQRKNKLLSGGNAEKARKKIEVAYASEIEEPHARLNEVASIQDLIIRNYVFEQFSPPGEVGDFELSIQSMPELMEFFGKNERVSEEFIGFLNKAAHYLRATKDKHLLETYTYKNSAGLTRNFDDCSVLASTIETLLRTKEPTQLNAQVSELYTAYMQFLVRRSMTASEKTASFTGKFPVLSLTYDFLNSVLTIPNVVIYDSSVVSLFDKLFQTVLASSFTKRELQQLRESFIQEIRGLDQQYDIKRIAGSYELKSIRDENRAYIPEDVRDFFVSDLMRLLLGVRNGVSLAFGSPTRKGVFKGSDVTSRFFSEVHKVLSIKSPDLNLAFRLLFTDADVYTDGALKNAGVTADLINNWAASHLTINDDRINKTLVERQLTETQAMMLSTAKKEKKNKEGSFRDFVAETEKRLNELRVLRPNFLVKNPSFENVNYFERYSAYYLDKPEAVYTPQEIEERVKANDQLWDSTLNRSMWFVSPRGDSFMADLDPELKSLEIDSLTFKVDPRYKREHKVEIKLAGLQQPVIVWLNVHRRLLSENRTPLDMKPMFVINLSKVLLERLSYITSGLMATASNPRDLVQTGYEDTPNFTYRRAHYDILRDPRFTMTSQAAETHAQEIFDIYGIDIFQERNRRQRLGILAPNEHLTFSKESVPDVVPSEPKPNVVVFKPELLEQFLQAQQQELVDGQ